MKVSSIVECMEDLWEWQASSEMQKETRSALYRGFHCLRKVADYKEALQLKDADYKKVQWTDLGKAISFMKKTLATVLVLSQSKITVLRMRCGNMSRDGLMG